MRPNPGDIIGGKYRILRMIGDGGMGAVYEARHEVLGTLVALKFLHAELARRPGLASRFLQEARVSASIQSPHVTKVTDVDQTPDGGPYLVMELLTGESLQQVIDRQRKLPRDQAIDYALQILSGLEAAHALGVVHRDLKPDNVFITPSPGGPVLKLLDFGIAKLRQTDDYSRGLTRPGALMGTPEYMPPEQLYSADRVDHRADLYSLGVILFEMLCGERPAQGEDAAMIVGNVMAGKVRRLDEIDRHQQPELVNVIHKAIDPDKTRRFQSAMEFRLALAPFAGQLSHAGRLAATPVPAGVSATAPPVQKETRRGPFPSEEPVVAPAQNKPGVAPTLPPDDDTAPAPRAGNPPTVSAAPAMGSPPTVGSGAGTVGPTPRGTQEASNEMVAQMVAAHAASQVTPDPVARPSAPAYAVAATAAPAGAAPYGYAPMPMKKKPKGGAGPIIALLAGLLVTAGIIGLVLMMRRGKDEPNPSNLQLGTATPNTTIAPQGGGNVETPPPGPGPGPVTPPAPEPGPKTGPTGKPSGKKDGGADGGEKDGGGQTSPWPFPVPSGVPTIPSGWPPIPNFGIPGLQPPPASSK